MAEINPGDVIAVPCEVGRGAFLGESLITIQSVDGPISGFVPRDSLERIEGDKAVIRGTVVEVKADTVLVQIQGSFFTTTGIANIPRRGEMQKLAAAAKH